MSLRDQSALFSYFKTVTEYKKELDAPFARFLLSVVKGDFLKLRYEDLSSPHMEKLKREYGDIWESWKTQVIPDANLSKASSSSSSINFLEYSQAILNHAKNIATDLGLELYSEGGAHRLDSLGSTVKLEYEDAVGGVNGGITNGVFTITQAKLV